METGRVGRHGPRTQTARGLAARLAWYGIGMDRGDDAGRTDRDDSGPRHGRAARRRGAPRAARALVARVYEEGLSPELAVAVTNALRAEAQPSRLDGVSGR
jgi:hypothetical protein